MTFQCYPAKYKFMRLICTLMIYTSSFAALLEELDQVYDWKVDDRLINVVYSEFMTQYWHLTTEFEKTEEGEHYCLSCLVPCY